MTDTDTELTGDALDERARELKIKGRSNMDADELRAAVAKAEAEAEPEPEGGGPAVPPDPPVGTDEETGGDQSALPSGALPKAALVARADSLLGGVSPALARGVLAEADDPITIDAAQRRIQEFLDGDVANTEEA